MSTNANKAEINRFQFTKSGHIYAILKETISPLGLKMEGQPYIGLVEPDTNRGRIFRHKAYDYCGHFVGSFITQDQAAEHLFKRWEENGMGAKIISGKMPYRVSIETEILVMADSEDDALDWMRRNRYEWSHMVDEADMYADLMTYTPSGWSDDSLLFGDAGNVSVKDARKLIEKQKAIIEKAKREEQQ